jgi:hypothetical protein
MKKLKISIALFLCVGILYSCKDQLDVKNPNQPTLSSINTEGNIVALGLGVYANGFRGVKYGGFQGQFLNDVWAYHEIMGDVIGVEAANVYINQLGMPDWVQLDNATQVLNPANPNTQWSLLRFVNQNSLADANPVYYEWGYMYALNNVCNQILKNVDQISYTGNADTRKNTIKAWAYWWKGYAYSRIGSLYYAGVINNEPYPGKISDVYVSKDQIIAEANSNFDHAITELNAVTSTFDYNTVLRSMIPSFNQVGKGNAPTVAMWIRNINTMKARNLLVNTKASAMTPAQWDEILALTNAGVQITDNVFIGKSNPTGDLIAPSGGTVALVAAGDPSSITYKISERLIQDFVPGDKRLSNNFSNNVKGGKWLGNSDRGNIFNTRYKLLDGGAGISGVIVYANSTAGLGEAYLASSYEENELMKAEANIYKNNLSTALASIDAVRTYQGAGLPSLAGLTDQALAKELLRSERRVALAFRALSFYDARRWGITDPVSSGGGRTNAVVVDKTGAVNTKAVINYNFLDYWDVPDNEIVFNSPAAGSAQVKNPKGL